MLASVTREKKKRRGWSVSISTGRKISKNFEKPTKKKTLIRRRERKKRGEKKEGAPVPLPRTGGKAAITAKRLQRPVKEKERRPGRKGP